jgi:hypothetical protein
VGKNFHPILQNAVTVREMSTLSKRANRLSKPNTRLLEFILLSWKSADEKYTKNVIYVIHGSYYMAKTTK